MVFSKKSRIKVMVIGAGKICQPHLDTLKRFKEVEIVAIANRSGKGLEELQKKYKIKETTTDWENYLKNNDVDAVWILVGHQQTYSVTKKCLELGIPSFIEKPAGLTIEEANSLAEISKESKVLNMVALNRRYYSVINQALKMIEMRGPLMGVVINAPEPIRLKKNEGRLDYEIYNRWLTANSIHFVDLMLYIGGKIKELNIFKNNFSDVSLVDNFHATFKFENGAIGSYIAHWLSGGIPLLELYGDGIKIHLPNLTKGTVFLENGKSYPLKPDSDDTRFKPGFYKQTQAFLNSLKGEKLASPAADLIEAQKAMDLIQKIYDE